MTKFPTSVTNGLRPTTKRFFSLVRFHDGFQLWELTLVMAFAPTLSSALKMGVAMGEPPKRVQRRQGTWERAT
jgi:hypothetical protein